MYHSKNYRGRGRGRGQKYQPYPRQSEGEDRRLPHPTPENMLSGTTTLERTVSKAKDDVRLATDWKTYFEKYFERERYHLPRPTDSHRVPKADSLNTKLDEILNSAKQRCREAIDEHLQDVSRRAEDRVNNPPKPAEASLAEEVSKLVQQSAQQWEFIMRHMGRTMNEVLEQRENRKKQDDETQQPDQ